MKFDENWRSNLSDLCDNLHLKIFVDQNCFSFLVLDDQKYAYSISFLKFLTLNNSIRTWFTFLFMQNSLRNDYQTSMT